MDLNSFKFTKKMGTCRFHTSYLIKSRRFNKGDGQCTGLVTVIAINERQTPLKLSVSG